MAEKDAFDLELELIKEYGRKIDGGILDNIRISRWVAQAGWKTEPILSNRLFAEGRSSR